MYVTGPELEFHSGLNLSPSLTYFGLNLVLSWKAGKQAEGRVGGAFCRLVKGMDIVDECVAMMKEGGTFRHRL